MHASTINLETYVQDLLAGGAYHMDVQMGNFRGSLLQYVSGYVAKMSSQFATEWLNDAASDYSIAARVLSEYHPLEPEMILQLAMQWFPQAMTGNAFVAPYVLPRTFRRYASVCHL